MENNEKSGEKLGVIKKFNSRIEAEIAKCFLESEGIRSYVAADDGGEMYPSLNPIRGIKLITDEKNLQRAIELLKKDLEENLHGSTEER